MSHLQEINYGNCHVCIEDPEEQDRLALIKSEIGNLSKFVFYSRKKSYRVAKDMFGAYCLQSAKAWKGKVAVSDACYDTISLSDLPKDVQIAMVNTINSIKQ